MKKSLSVKYLHRMMACTDKRMVKVCRQAVTEAPENAIHQTSEFLLAMGFYKGWLSRKVEEHLEAENYGVKPGFSQKILERVKSRKTAQGASARQNAVRGSKKLNALRKKAARPLKTRDSGRSRAVGS